MNNDSQTLRIDISKGNPEDNLDFIKQVEMSLSNESVEERQGNRRIKHLLSWIATVDLDGTVIHCSSSGNYAGISTAPYR